MGHFVLVCLDLDCCVTNYSSQLWLFVVQEVGGEGVGGGVEMSADYNLFSMQAFPPKFVYW